MESIALITLINSLPHNSQLRDIAERRLCDLQREKPTIVPDQTPEFIDRHIHANKCRDIKTGKTYDSINSASKAMKIGRYRLNNDLNLGTGKFVVRPFLF